MKFVANFILVAIHNVATAQAIDFLAERGRDIDPNMVVEMVGPRRGLEDLFQMREKG